VPLLARLHESLLAPLVRLLRLRERVHVGRHRRFKTSLSAEGGRSRQSSRPKDLGAHHILRLHTDARLQARPRCKSTQRNPPSSSPLHCLQVFLCGEMQATYT
jgi:hypothetical protein